jgi:ethanolamine utilization protein EutA
VPDHVHSPGQQHGHDHSPGHDHDHDDDPGPLEDNPIWQQENVTLRSVGIDIGSSGTQAVFSELKLQRDGAGLATRFVVVERRCLFESPVEFTPFGADGLIDAPGIGTIMDQAYAAAGVEPAAVDTGVVILTGEALRRQNAENIALVIAERAGDFVCATAGHHMEATLAAYGSGAARLSADTGRRILNVDIGGGTTKLSILVDGQVTATAALHVGGRLVVADEAGRVVRLEDAGRDHALTAGVTLRLGGQVSPAELDAVAEEMAGVLVAALRPGADPDDLPYLTEPIGDLGGIDGVLFSGGVAEYVYGNEERDFGDLGLRLGAVVSRRLADGSIRFPLLPAGARIRATALGASEFSVQLSGTTCFASDVAKLLPRRNIQVLRPDCPLADEIDVTALTDAIGRHLRSFGAQDGEQDVVLALSWAGRVSHRRLHALGRAVVAGLADRIAAGRPVLLALDADVGRSLGRLLRAELAVPVDVLVVDGLTLLDFDYIDLGRPLQPSNVIPVTIKSLVF